MYFPLPSPPHFSLSSYCIPLKCYCTSSTRIPVKLLFTCIRSCLSSRRMKLQNSKQRMQAQEQVVQEARLLSDTFQDLCTVTPRKVDGEGDEGKESGGGKKSVKGEEILLGGIACTLTDVHTTFACAYVEIKLEVNLASFCLILNLILPHLTSSCLICLHLPSSCPILPCLASSCLIFPHLPSSCPVLPHLASSCLIFTDLPSSCPILPHLASSAFILPHLTSSCLIFPHLPSSCPILPHLASSCLICLHLTSSCLIFPHLPSSCPILPHLASSCLICLHLTSPCLILPHLPSSCPILPHLTSSCPILPHLASSYLILPSSCPILPLLPHLASI